MNQEALVNTCRVLGEDSVVHITPPVLGRGLEGSNGRIRSGRGKVGLYRDDEAVGAVLCKDGHAVHLLVDADKERAAVAHNGLQVGQQLAGLVKVILETVYVLPACYRRVIHKVVTVPVIPGPSGKWNAGAAAVRNCPVHNLDSVRECCFQWLLHVVGGAFHAFPPEGDSEAVQRFSRTHGSRGCAVARPV